MPQRAVAVVHLGCIRDPVWNIGLADSGKPYQIYKEEPVVPGDSITIGIVSDTHFWPDSPTGFGRQLQQHTRYIQAVLWEEMQAAPAPARP